MRLQLNRSLVEILQLVELQHGFAVNPDQARGVLYAKLEQPPPLGFDPGVETTFGGVQGAGGIMRALHVVKLDLIVPATRTLPRRSEHDAAIVMTGMPDIHLKFKVAKLLVGGEVAVAIAVEYSAKGLKQRLAIRDVPQAQVRRRR